MKILVVKNRRGCYHSYTKSCEVYNGELFAEQSPLAVHAFLKNIVERGEINNIKKLVYGQHDDDDKFTTLSGTPGIRSCDVGLIIRYPNSITFEILSDPYNMSSNVLFTGDVIKGKHYITGITGVNPYLYPSKELKTLLTIEKKLKSQLKSIQLKMKVVRNEIENIKPKCNHRNKFNEFMSVSEGQDPGSGRNSYYCGICYKKNSLKIISFMKTDFRIVGLSAPKSATLEFLHTDSTTFWAVVDMPDDRYKALFNWAKSDDTFWKDKKIAEIEHDGFNEDGTPHKPKMIGIREWDI